MTKAPKERRTLLITDSNGSVPSTPTEAKPKSRTTSESQQVVAVETRTPFGILTKLLLQRKLILKPFPPPAIATNAAAGVSSTANVATNCSIFP